MTALPVVLAGLLAGTAVALLLPGGAHRRLSVVLGWGSGSVPVDPENVARGRGRRRPSPTMLAAGTGGLGVAVLVGGATGALLGAVAAVVAFVLLGRLEPRAVRQRRERVAADLPTALDLLAACLTVGRPPTQALRSVAAALGGPLAHDLGVVTVRLELGSDPVGVWRELGLQTGPLAPLGRTMARSLETGAPMADGLRRLADDRRRSVRAQAERQARSVGVRAAAPLGLCFLPAFVLIGIVPSIVSAFSVMSWW